jgi:hypothetical protein
MVSREPSAQEELDEALTPGPELDEELPEVRLPRLMGQRRGARQIRGRALVAPDLAGKPTITPEQRLLLLDTWRRSGLPAGDFADLVRLSKHTLYAWKKAFEEHGPGGLADKPKGGPWPSPAGCDSMV